MSVITRCGSLRPTSFISGSIALKRLTSSPAFPGLQCMISRMRYIPPPCLYDFRVDRDLHRAAIGIRHGTPPLRFLRELGESGRVEALESVRRDLEPRRSDL